MSRLGREGSEEKSNRIKIIFSERSYRSITADQGECREMLNSRPFPNWSLDPKVRNVIGVRAQFGSHRHRSITGFRCLRFGSNLRHHRHENPKRLNQPTVLPRRMGRHGPASGPAVALALFPVIPQWLHAHSRVEKVLSCRLKFKPQSSNQGTN